METSEVKKKMVRTKMGKYTTKLICSTLYKKWHKETEFKDVDIKMFKNIWLGIVDEIVYEICTNPNGFNIPYNCGDLGVKYTKLRKPALDGYGNECLNFHSNGKTAKLVFITNFARKRNRYCRYFGFEPTKEVRDAVSKALSTRPDVFKDATVSKEYIKYLHFKGKKEALLNDNININKTSDL